MGALSQLAEGDVEIWREEVTLALRRAKTFKIHGTGDTKQSTDNIFIYEEDGFKAYEIFWVARAEDGANEGDGIAYGLTRAASSESGKVTTVFGGSAGALTRDTAFNTNPFMVIDENPVSGLRQALTYNVSNQSAPGFTVVGFIDVVLSSINV